MTKRTRISKRTTRKLHRGVVVRYIEQELERLEPITPEFDYYLIVSRENWEAITKAWSKPYDKTNPDQS